MIHSLAVGSVPDPQTSLQLTVQLETEYIVSVSHSNSGCIFLAAVLMI